MNLIEVLNNSPAYQHKRVARILDDIQRKGTMSFTKINQNFANDLISREYIPNINGRTYPPVQLDRSMSSIRGTRASQISFDEQTVDTNLNESFREAIRQMTEAFFSR